MLLAYRSLEAKSSNRQRKRLARDSKKPAAPWAVLLRASVGRRRAATLASVDTRARHAEVKATTLMESRPLAVSPSLRRLQEVRWQSPV